MILKGSSALYSLNDAEKSCYMPGKVRLSCILVMENFVLVDLKIDKSFFEKFIRNAEYNLFPTFYKIFYNDAKLKENIYKDIFCFSHLKYFDNILYNTS